MEISLKVSDKSFDELMALFFCEMSCDDDFYDIVAAQLAAGYRQQLEIMLDSLSVKRLRAGICGLGIVSSIESESAIKRFIGHDEPFVVAAAIDGLSLLVLRIGLRFRGNYSIPLHLFVVPRFALQRIGWVRKLCLCCCVGFMIKTRSCEKMQSMSWMGLFRLIVPIL